MGDIIQLRNDSEYERIFKDIDFIRILFTDDLKYIFNFLKAYKFSHKPRLIEEYSASPRSLLGIVSCELSPDRNWSKWNVT